LLPPSDPFPFPSRGTLPALAVDWRGHLHPEGGAVTEKQWLACTDPTPMLQFLGASGKLSELRYLGKKASGRKLRLFAATCVRRIGGLLSDERSRRAADSAERYADRQVKRQELRAATVAAPGPPKNAAPALPLGAVAAGVRNRRRGGTMPLEK